MIKVKEGVIFKCLRPEIYTILGHIDSIFKAAGAEAVITSAADGKHMRESFHYRDLALDLRSKQLSNDQVKLEVLEQLRKKLGEKYQVILESLGKPGEHYHCEFDWQEIVGLP